MGLGAQASERLAELVGSAMACAGADDVVEAAQIEEAELFGALECVVEAFGGEAGCEVQAGARDGGDRDAAVGRDVAGVQRRAVDVDAA